MERTYKTAEEAQAVAKEALWLAWNAVGSPSGMGVLQDRPNADREEVWENARTMGDYPGNRGFHPTQVHADYVFGRMMKLYFTLDGKTITHSDETPRPDYQAWCHACPTYNDLFVAAEDSMQVHRETPTPIPNEEL